MISKPVSSRDPEAQRRLDRALDDQKSSWDRGERTPVEDFLARDPALRDDADAILDLIYQEYLLRRDGGEDPDPHEFYARFPEHAASLMIQFGIDAAIEPTTQIANGQGPPHPVALPPIEGIDGLVVTGVIGRGGMGVVYQARDTKLDRIVAVKTIAAGQEATADQIARFRSEAQAVARLRHPNIIAIHAIGEHEGRPYLSLEFAEGGSLAQRLAEKPMAPRDAAGLLESLARAVHAAHQAGVVHRDLKPSNVLLTRDGVPKVGDFGLAKLLGSDSGRTLSGQPVGTPSYMAPEQAQGRSKHVGPPADVYALGAILYQALTGRPPFLGESPLETLKLVVSAEPVPPHLLRPNVPRDLETICLKCLEKEPAKRYDSALALAEDLRRYLDGRPIAARPVGPAGRSWRWARRNPWVAGLASAVFVLLVTGTVVSTTLAIRATRAEAATREQRNRAERARDQAFHAINAIVLTEGDRMRSVVLAEDGRMSRIVRADEDRARSEELRPYREPLIQEALRLASEIVAEPEGDPRAETTHADALMAHAKLLQEKGERGQARQVGLKAIEVVRGLVARDPTSFDHRAALASSLHQVSQFTDDPEASRADATESNRIYEVLLRESSRSDRTNEWTREVTLNLRHIGHMYFQQNWELRSPERMELLRRAIEAFLVAKALCERQIDVVAPERRDGFVYSLALNEIYLCRVHRSMAVQYADAPERRAQIRKAVEYGDRAISHFQAIVDRNPNQFHYGWELHIAQRELADLYLDAEQGNDQIAAIPYYDRSRETLKALAVRQGKLVSRVAAIQGALAIVGYNEQLAFNADLPRFYAGRRRAIISEMHEICDKLSLVQPLSQDLLKIHAHTCLDMVDYQSFDGEQPDIALCLRAEQLWDRLYRDNPRNLEAAGMLAVARRKLADMLEEGRQPRDAALWRRRSLESARGNPALFYILAANCYALTAQVIPTIPSKLGRDQIEKDRGRAIAEGIAMLREAVAAGFRDLKRLRDDPLLEPLRGSPEFQAIILNILDAQFPARPFARDDWSATGVPRSD